jgi:hypothetical protein
MHGVALKLNTRNWTTAQRTMLKRVVNPELPLRRWALDTGKSIDKSWDEMRAGGMLSGGTFRGQTPWKPISPKAIGRKRPSGAKLTGGDVVGKDTHQMANAFTEAPVLSSDKRSISLVTNLRYAVHQNNLRQYNEPTEEDNQNLSRHFVGWLDALIEYARRTGR